MAYLVFGVCTACYIAAVVFEFVNATPTSSSWGTGNQVVALAFAFATYCFPVVGLLITQRDPANSIGWLMLGIGLVWGGIALADGYVQYALVSNPGSLPAPELIAAVAGPSWIAAIGLMCVFLILLFPNGHLLSRRWRVLAWVTGVDIAVGTLATLLRPGDVNDASVAGLRNPLGVEALRNVLVWMDAALVILPLCMVASAVGLVVRFRRAGGIERLQLKWLATAGALVAGLYLMTIAATLLPTSEPAPTWVLMLQDSSLVSFALIPLSIGVAVLKHRLYGIDVVINKSFVFGTSAAFITGVYVAIVVGIGSLVGRGDRPNLALSIAATAVVAVAFQPVRDRLQRLANRLVYGARATPYEVLSDFADRMGGTYDAADLLPTMARAVGEGVGASHVEVWLSVGRQLAAEAFWPSPPDSIVRPMPTAVDDLAALNADRVVPVRHDGELLGAITVTKPPGEAVTPAEQKLLDDVSAQAGLVLRNVRLIEDLRSSRQRLVTTQDDERRRLERNLHDGAQQSIVSVALMLRMVRGRLDGAPAPAGETLDAAADQLSLAIDELRDLARGIHPAILSERGLGPAISSLAERCPVPVIVEHRLTERLPVELERTLYFTAAEALDNAVKHAHATQVDVVVRRSETELVLEISDDGIGGADRTTGSGLRGIDDRVSVVDGTLDLRSSPGRGTRLTCSLPLPPIVRVDLGSGQQRIPLPLRAAQ